MTRYPSQRPRIVVVGGGISGLAAAWFVSTRTAAWPAARRPEVVVLEASDRFGGAVGTELHDGFLLERGPDSFITSPDAMLRLVAELGLDDQLVTPRRCVPPLYVWRDGALRAMPPSMMLVVPGDRAPFEASDLLSASAKAAVLAEPQRPWAPVEDITMGAFFRARFGDEVTDQLVAPVLAGIYSGDVDRLSLRSTFPRFIEMVERHGSLLAGGRSWVAAKRGQLPFRSLRAGMGGLIDALVHRLPGVGAELRLRARAQQVTREPGGRVRVDGVDGEGAFSICADALVMGLPAYASAALLSTMAPELAARLKEIPYTSTGCVYLGVEGAQAEAVPAAAGVLFPRTPEWTVKGVQLGANKFYGRAPEGGQLLRVFIGGDGWEEVLDVDDEALVGRCVADLQRALGTSLAPSFSKVFRYPSRTPQYTLGHGERVAKLLSELPDDVHLTGSAYLGVGLPACVGTGRDAAARFVARLQQTT